MTTPKTPRNIEIFRKVLAGKSVKELSAEYNIVGQHVRNILKTLVRRINRYIHENHKDIDFSPFRSQTAPKEFQENPVAWKVFLDLYEQHCKDVTASNQTKAADSLKYAKLGEFTYHARRVLFESAEDESDFRISYWGSTKAHRSAEWDETPHEIKNTDDLRVARRWYEDTVTNVMMNTSYTDVSIYMQQYAEPGK